MENLVVASFQILQQANASINKLKELDEIGDIVIYNQVLIRKDKENQYTSLFHEGPDTLDLPAEGTLIGSIAGLVGGPVGVAIGAISGLLAGTLNQNYSEDFYKEVLNRVKNQLQEGNHALILDVEEENSSTIDSYLAAFDAKIVRIELAAAYNRYDNKRWNELDDEIDAEEIALEKAAEKDKAAIREKISQLKARREERNEKFGARMDHAKKQLHEKIENLKAKIKTSDNNRKARLEGHKAKVEEKLHEWNKQVSSAFI